MDPVVFVSALGGSFMTGATGSLHCALMCGPLACAVPAGAPGSRVTASLAWQLGRAAAYSAVGLVLGLTGAGLSRAVALDLQLALPWVMVVGLVVSAFDLGRHLGPLPFVGKVTAALSGVAMRLPPTRRALVLGAATPFLPCGFLYGLFLAAAASGAWWAGALVMLAFALGGVPALLAVQLGASAWARWPRATALLRRVVPLTAALVIAWRAYAALTAPAANCG